MEPQQGDIYWVNIPQSHTEGSEQFGRKPFIVMSRDSVNKKLKTVLVVPMTTYQGKTVDPRTVAQEPPWRIVVPPTEIERDVACKTTLLLSVAKTDQVRVIDKTRLGERVGRLSQTAVLSIGAGLAYVFNIA